MVGRALHALRAPASLVIMLSTYIFLQNFGKKYLASNIRIFANFWPISSQLGIFTIIDVTNLMKNFVFWKMEYISMSRWREQGLYIPCISLSFIGMKLRTIFKKPSTLNSHFTSIKPNKPSSLYPKIIF